MRAAEADAAFLRAQALHRAGQLKEAEREYHNAAALNPQRGDALHMQGVVLAQMGSPQAALAVLQKALALIPLDAAAHNNLGRIQIQLGQTEQAEQSLRRAVALAPALVEALFNLANVCKSGGRLDEAGVLYRRTLAANPRHAGAHYNLGNLLREQGHHRSSMESLERAVQLRPQWADARNNYGTALLEWDRVTEARDQFAEALRLDPTSASCARNLAQTLDRMGETEASRAVYRQLRQIEPDNPLLDLTLASLFPPVAPDADSIRAYADGLHAVLDRLMARPQPHTPEDLYKAAAYPPFQLNYLGLDDLPLRRRYAEWISRSVAPPPLPDWQHDIPRIGFAVTAGHEGVFIKCMRGLLGQMDRSKMRVTVVYSEPNGRRILEPALAGQSLEWLGLQGDLAAMADTLRSAELDVLYWWEVGSDAANYFLPWMRGARVQLTSWGWPCSSGIPAMDVFLSARGLEGADASTRYSEPLAVMERLPVHYARPPVPSGGGIRERLGFTPGQHLYLCQQNLRKVHPDFDALAAGILRADPLGVVVFLSDKQDSVTRLLRERLQRTAPDVSDRLRFLPRLPEADYLMLLKEADVALDTTHYGGGANTVYDAFACGTPLVTLPTAYCRGRYAQAAYAQMGVAGPVARDASDYIRLAVDLGGHPEARQQLSQAILGALDTVLDDAEAAREFEQTLLRLARGRAAP